MMLTDIDRFAAASALIDWFESQSINPADAAAIMSTVMAIAITNQKHVNPELAFARVPETIKQLLIVDIREQLRLQKEFG